MQNVDLYNGKSNAQHFETSRDKRKQKVGILKKK